MIKTKPSKSAGTDANTVRFHRVFATKPEKLYRAFLDADAMAKWLPPYGFTAKVHHLDAKVGGTFRMSFANFTTGKSHAFGGEYLELVPNERIVSTYEMRLDQARISVSLATVEFKPAGIGTKLIYTEQAVHLDGHDTPEGREHGTRGLLDQLEQALKAGL